ADPEQIGGISGFKAGEAVQVCSHPHGQKRPRCRRGFFSVGLFPLGGAMDYGVGFYCKLCGETYPRWLEHHLKFSPSMASLSNVVDTSDAHATQRDGSDLHCLAPLKLFPNVVEASTQHLIDQLFRSQLDCCLALIMIGGGISRRVLRLLAQKVLKTIQYY